MVDSETIKIYEQIKRAQSGEQTAKEELISQNAGLIWSIVKKFLGRGYEAEDLYQIGSIGLLKCIEKFDLSYEVKFSTYAVPMIMGEIKRFIRDDGMIKVSRSLKETAVKAKYTAEAMSQKNGESPTISQIADEIGIDSTELMLALDSNMEVESLYSTIYQSDGNPIYLIDKLVEDDGPETNMVDNIALKQIIYKLPPKERQIIMMRYFDDKTQQEIASIIGISQVQVSRIERKILNTIRESFG